jgi:hypothetical protein
MSANRITHAKYGQMQTLVKTLCGHDRSIHYKNKRKDVLWCVTMIDPATIWFDIKQVENREVHTVASVVEQTWPTRYPWPTIVVFFKGAEFMGDFARMVAKDYGIERKGISVRNPQVDYMSSEVEAEDEDMEEEEPYELEGEGYVGQPPVITKDDHI